MSTETSFLQFLRQISPRFLQEREVGLDLYLSGPWTWAVLALGVAAATVFALALFHFVPLRRHSIAALALCGGLALAAGLAGAWLGHAALAGAPPEGPLPDVLVRGAGREPATLAQRATLLCLPLLAGAAVALASLAGALFLLVFGGRDGSSAASAGKRDGKRGGERG